VVLNVSPDPIRGWREFPRPSRAFFHRLGSVRTPERGAPGLIADISPKSGAGIAAAVAGLPDSAPSRPREETS
jgi:hypothetical protein